jgi:hypothetical protein
MRLILGGQTVLLAMESVLFENDRDFDCMNNSNLTCLAFVFSLILLIGWPSYGSVSFHVVRSPSHPTPIRLRQGWVGGWKLCVVIFIRPFAIAACVGLSYSLLSESGTSKHGRDKLLEANADCEEGAENCPELDTCRPSRCHTIVARVVRGAGTNGMGVLSITDSRSSIFTWLSIHFAYFIPFKAAAIAVAIPLSVDK